MLLSIDWTLPIVMVMFLVYAVLMNQLFFGPVTRALAARKAHVKEQQAQAAAALAQAHTLQADYASKLKDAQGQAAKAIQAALKASEGRRQALLEQVKGEVAAEVATARTSIQAERDAALASLSGEVSAFSESIKRKVVGGTPALSSTGGHES